MHDESREATIRNLQLEQRMGSQDIIAYFCCSDVSFGSVIKEGDDTHIPHDIHREDMEWQIEIPDYVQRRVKEKGCISVDVKCALHSNGRLRVVDHDSHVYLSSLWQRMKNTILGSIH